jgi:gluconokinase
LANALRWTFVDGDAFHPLSNIDKMSHGIPLTDADRLPWLLVLRQSIDRWLQEDRNVVLACSALKASYRKILMEGTVQTKLVYLKSTYGLLQGRIAQRRHHFMPEELLGSQINILEEPTDAITVDAVEPPEKIIEQIRTHLKL